MCIRDRVNICLNYGGRDEILRAARAYALDCVEGRADPNHLTQENFSGYLFSRGVPDPDLIIRPSGEPVSYTHLDVYKRQDFDFELPEELIAQTPLERRDASRLLTLDKYTGETGHHHFYELPRFLRPGDCLVLNDSRVLPARLIGRRSTGGACEVLLLIDKGEGLDVYKRQAVH